MPCRLDSCCVHSNSTIGSANPSRCGTGRLDRSSAVPVRGLRQAGCGLMRPPLTHVPPELSGSTDAGLRCSQGRGQAVCYRCCAGHPDVEVRDTEHPDPNRSRVANAYPVALYAGSASTLPPAGSLGMDHAGPCPKVTSRGSADRSGWAPSRTIAVSAPDESEPLGTAGVLTDRNSHHGSVNQDAQVIRRADAAPVRAAVKTMVCSPAPGGRPFGVPRDRRPSRVATAASGFHSTRRSFRSFLSGQARLRRRRTARRA